MYVIEKDKGFVFRGYGYNERPQWDTVIERDYIVPDSVEVKIFITEVAAVVEANHIQETFHIPVKIVSFKEWCEKNNIGGL